MYTMIRKSDIRLNGLAFLGLVSLVLSGCLRFAPPIGPTAAPRETSPSLNPTPTLPAPALPPEATPTSLNSTAAQPTTPASSPTQLPEADAELFTTRGLLPGQTLEISTQPGSSHPAAGKIPAGAQDIRSLGGSENINSSRWLQIQYREQTGWVQERNLARQVGQVPPALSRKSLEVLTFFRNQEYSGLSRYIHPDLCLRFSPYPNLNPENLRFCPAQISALFKSDEVQVWGRYDGTGEPIRLTGPEYAEEFIYDQDYLNAPVVGYNQPVSSGNSLNNIQDIYPEAVFIEYHFPEIDPQYGGMDWRSLRLVYQKIDQIWYLIAVVHGEWTI
jgi:hypothetical protein